MQRYLEDPHNKRPFWLTLRVAEGAFFPLLPTYDSNPYTHWASIDRTDHNRVTIDRTDHDRHRVD